MDANVDSQQLSTAAKVVLGVAGFAVVTITIYVVIGVMRVLRSVLQVKVPKKKSVSSKGASKQAVKPAELLRPDNEARGPDLKTLIKDSQKAAKTKTQKEDPAAAHELFLNTLKGHGDLVSDMAWSPDNKFVASACDDMYVRVYDVSDITNKDPKHRKIKTAKLPIGVGFGDDTDSVVVLMKGVPDAIVAKYATVQQKPGDAVGEQQWQVPNVHGKELGMALRSVPAMSCIGRTGVAVSCSTKKDVKVLSMQGNELATLEPASFANYDLALSNDGRFVAVATFTSEVKIWELRYNKDNVGFKGAAKVMDLKGHKSQVCCVAFSHDSKKVVTASKDGTLRVWNIDVRFALEEDPKTLKVVAIPLPNGKCYERLAFGPNGMIAASYEGHIHFIRSSNGELAASVEAHDSTITAMRWAPTLLKGNMAVLATCSKDKRLRLWRSP